MDGVRVDKSAAMDTQLAASQQVNTAVKATLGGQQLVKVPNMNQILQDFAEESSFGHSETVEKDDKLEDAVEDRSRKVREQMVKKIKEIYQGAPPKENHSTQLDRLRRMANRSDYSAADLLNDLEEQSGDRGEIFATLLELQETTDSESTATTIKQALDIVANKWESQIFAAANTLDDAIKFSSRGGVKHDELQRCYQDSVVEYSSVIGTIAELVRSFGISGLEAGSAFLQQAALSDLSAMPCSVDKEKLNATLLELQGMKVMHTINEGVSTSLTRAASSDVTLSKIEQEWLMGNFLRSLDDPNIFPLNIKGPIDESTNPQSKVLFLQDLKQQIADLPEHYFQSGQKERSIAPWQHEIDHLVQIEADNA